MLQRVFSEIFQLYLTLQLFDFCTVVYSAAGFYFFVLSTFNSH